MSRSRWFIERRHGDHDYTPIGGQPAEGFASVKDAVDWLIGRGAVHKRLDADKQVFYEGWGGPRGLYAREVPQPRRSLRERMSSALDRLAIPERRRV